MFLLWAHNIGKYQMVGGGQRHALLLFCGKSPKLGNGGREIPLGKGGVGHGFGPGVLLAVNLPGKWIGRHPFAFLCLFSHYFHYSKMDHSHLLLGLPGRVFSLVTGLTGISRDIGERWAVDSLAPCLGALFREHTLETLCCFWGAGMTRYMALVVYWVWRKGYLFWVVVQEMLKT